MVWAAWTNAALQRSKKMPALDKLLTKKKPQPKRGKAKSWQAQLAAWERFLK